MSQLSDAELVELYRRWSEEFWCAGFMSATEGTVRQFRKWLTTLGRDVPEVSTDYELEFLTEYKRQCGEEVPAP